MTRKYFEVSNEKKWNKFKGKLISEYGTITKGMEVIMSSYLGVK